MKTYVDIKTVYGREKIEVMNSMHAVEEWFRVRDDFNIGSSEVDHVKFFKDGKKVADIEYNGTLTNE